MELPTTSIILETRVTKKDGTHPIKLRVTHNRKQKYYALKGILKQYSTSYTKDEFEKIISPKPRNEFKQIKILLNEIEQKAIELINKIDNFSFDEFEKRFNKKNKDSKLLKDLFQLKIDELEKENKITTSVTYKAALNSLIQFSDNTNLVIQSITIDFLNRYEKYMINENKSYTTIGIYLRNLKHIVNIAIKQNLLNSNQYPFGLKKDGKYQIPKSKNIKKALTIDEIQKIYNYVPISEMEQKAKDYWLFSYLCNGMNVVDILNLKYENITDNRIKFYRKKTINTLNTKKKITVVITENIFEIISRIGNQKKESKNYIFPILSDGLTATEQLKIVKQFTKQINKYIKRIALNVGITQNISTYSARHSFSTILKNNNVSTEFISESLGHTSLKTTDNYLDSFKDEIKEKNANILTDFNNK